MDESQRVTPGALQSINTKAETRRHLSQSFGKAASPYIVPGKRKTHPRPPRSLSTARDPQAPLNH